MKPPLFIPLKTVYFEQFASGAKDTEYRPYGPRWNERVCYNGRPVTLSRGYGKYARLSGVIVSTAIRADIENIEGWADCYGKGRTNVFCIKIRLLATPHATPQQPVASGEVRKAIHKVIFDEWSKSSPVEPEELSGRILAALRARLLELEEDKADLDWLEAKRAGCNFGPRDNPTKFHCWIEDDSTVTHYHGDTVRAAIRAARKGDK